MKKYIGLNLVLLMFVFTAPSCKGHHKTDQVKDSTNVLNLSDEQYKNMVGKWALVNSDEEGFETLELFNDGSYRLKSGSIKDHDKWSIVGTQNMLLGDAKYRFFFNRKNLVLEDKKGKRYELAKQDIETPDIQSVLNSDTLISPFVRRIFQDKSGNLWFGTNGDGVVRYDGDALEYFSIDEGFGGVAVRGIVGDAAGNVWFGTEGGLTKYDGASFTNYTEKDGLINNDVWSMVIDSKGIIWIGTLQGVCHFNGKEFTPFEMPATEPDPNRGVTSAKIVHSIMEDSKGRMWFGTNGGAYIYDARLPDGQGKSLSNISTKDGLPDNSVNDILEDKDGNIWFATHYKGVCYWDGTSFNRMATKQRESGTEAWSLYKDKSDNIWFPIENFGMYRYDGKTLTNFDKNSGLASGAIQCAFEDGEGRLWLGGWMGLFRYDGNSFKSVTKFGPWN